MTDRFRLVLASFAILFGVVGGAKTAEATRRWEPWSDLNPNEEIEDQPPAATRAQDDLRARSPGFRVGFGSYESIQVNVDALGHNIVGDAANEPSIAVNPVNPANKVIGWRQFDSIASSFRQAGWGYTFNAGQTWTFPGVLEPGVFRSDPALDSDANGIFYYQSLKGDFLVDVYRSANGGQTRLPPVAEFGGDKNWIAIDRTGGVGDGNIYGIWQEGGSCCGTNTFTRSANGGASFENPVPVTFVPFFGTLTVGPDGAVYASGGDGSAGQDTSHFVVSKSTTARDPGALPTFTGTRVELGGFMAFGGPNPAGLAGQANVATDDYSSGPTRGNVYLLASVTFGSGGDPLDVRLARSTDGGATWGGPIRVNDDLSDANWQWFGALAVAPDGRLDVIWNDTRNTGQINRSQLFYAYSYDAGTTWSRNVAVTPAFDSFIGWPQQNKLGDYSTIVSDATGGDVAFAATFNGEQDVYYVRVFPDCNGNGVSDLTDIAGQASADCDANRVPDECQAVPLVPGCAGAGVVPDGGAVSGAPLRLAKGAEGEVVLGWGASCASGDDDYAVYEGALGDFTSHSARLCTTLGATTVALAPGAAATYYLVVPERGVLEGSYGKNSAGSERPQGHSACHPRSIGPCAR